MDKKKYKWTVPLRYKSVDEMVWKKCGWRFKIRWFLRKLWRDNNGN